MNIRHAGLLALLPSLLTASPALAQSARPPEATATAVNDAAKTAFEKLKTLDGSWAGQVTTTPPAPEADGKAVQLSMQVTSRGHAFVHEMSIAGLPDHPVTLMYLDGSLTLTHYCDAGNRPRMTGKLSPDGKTVEFEFLELSGGNERGHMHRAVFTFIDENHHSEDWTYMLPGDKPVRAHFDLRRTTVERPSSR